MEVKLATSLALAALVTGIDEPDPGRGGSSHGWQDAKGDVWVPSGQGGRAHGGPHWDANSWWQLQKCQTTTAMKNIQIIDGAQNCVYDIFAATDEEFATIFPPGTDIAFINEVYERGDGKLLDVVFDRIWQRRVKKADAQGIHGVVFYELDKKKAYYPTRKDEEAVNPDGTNLR